MFPDDDNDDDDDDDMTKHLPDTSVLYKARFPFKRNRLRCVRCVHCVNENRNKRKRQPIGMFGRSSGNHESCLPTQALAFLVVFVYATHATQAIAFEWIMETGLNTLIVQLQ